MPQQPSKPAEDILLYLPIDAAVVIDAGELAFLASGKVVNGQAAVGADAAAKKAAAALAFAGVSNGVRVATDAAGEVPVYTNRIFRFDLDTATTIAPGDLIAPALNGGATLVEKRKVSKASAANQAIGKPMEFGTNLTSVLVHIKSPLVM